ncbi:Integrator complex subunit 11 [Acanthocheilonema viteae]
MPEIKIVPLGAGRDVGRSCILVSIGGRNVMLDCGMHMGYSDERRFPDFSFISGGGSLTEFVDCVIITHFHLDHCGSLPHMSEVVGYDGPIYMTYPTKAIAPVLLEDYRKVQTEFKGDKNFFTSQMIKNCMKKVIAINIHEKIDVDNELSIRAFYAGHVLGAAMFQIVVGSESVLYTGDFNTTPDRHLGAARVEPGLKPDILISESTYATTIRDSKRARERDFLKKVHDTVSNGGKVLIPVFALGRAQELCILLESYWERMNLKYPIFFSQGLAEKANQYYRLFISWTNEKIKRTFVERNMFDFKHIRPFEQSYIDSPGPMVLFSTPGMLHGGQSLRVFTKWCSDEKNLIIMPGFCVANTVGAKVISGMKKIEIAGRMREINLGVEYMSFSAHADAKGIMQLIRDCQPRNVMFVHGEDAKMEFLKEKVEKEFNLKVFKPANGETVTIETPLNICLNIPVQIIDRCINLDPTPSKRFCPFRAFLAMDKQTNQLEVMTPEAAARQLGKCLHTIAFGETVEVDHVNWKVFAAKLKVYDPNLQVKEDGIEMFNGEVTLISIPGDSKHVKVVWDEIREKWSEEIITALKEKAHSFQGS